MGFNNKPDERFQNDGRQSEYSQYTGLDFTDVKPIVRPEAEPEADINKMLARYGINPLGLREMTYGAEIDDRLDLQQALAAIEEAKRIQVPEELKHKYHDWRQVLNAAETGEYQYDLDQLRLRNEEAERKAKAAEIAASPSSDPVP